MKERSFYVPPFEGKAAHQFINQLKGIAVRMGSQAGIFGGGQDTVVAENFLYFEQANTCLNQMGCIAMTQTVWSNFFLIPHSRATLRRVL